MLNFSLFGTQEPLHYYKHTQVASVPRAIQHRGDGAHCGLRIFPIALVVEPSNCRFFFPYCFKNAVLENEILGGTTVEEA